MLWLTLILALVLSAAALAWVVWPLTRHAPAPLIVEDDRLAVLLGRKDAVMAAIKDLEFDHKVGKLSEEDFERYDQRLRRQAIGLIQQIEQVAPESTSLDETIEAEIIRRRKVQVQRPEPAVAAPRPAQVAAIPAAPLPVSAGNGLSNGSPRFCTECGARIEPQHKFCAQCGTPVTAR